MKNFLVTTLAAATLAVLALAAASCSKPEELTLAEADALSAAGASGIDDLLARTVSKPYQGQPWTTGAVGGSWNGSKLKDPKSFNDVIAEQDAETSAVVSALRDWLMDYDPLKREWTPRLASFEITTDEAADTLRIVFTLRDDAFWTYYGTDRREPVTSDDVIFWYDDIEGDPAFNSSGYNSQFVTMRDGTEKHIDIERIDDKRFAFNYPRIVADPLLSTNMDFGPRHVYKPAKDAGGPEAVLNLFSVDSDPRAIPSCGEWFLTEYTPSQRLVFTRNADFWDKDAAGVASPYLETQIIKIVSDQNTQKLLFQSGELETYSPRPEDLDEIIGGQAAGAYTVFNAEGAFTAQFWSFNENPAKNADKPFHAWFVRKEFRQAMSRIVNRDRLNTQVYRGLAQPKTYAFPPTNPFYNPAITFQYTYDPAEAERLLGTIGMKRGADGVMRDDAGNAVEFDLAITGDNTVTADVASVIADEASKIGVKINIRALDFQKIVDDLFSGFEWQSVIIGLTGSEMFPTQGSNVWPSTGNLHLWYPRQPAPATDWEARIDYLYNEGSYTADKDAARPIWDEYQRIILEQCPVIYLMRSRSFYALNNRWDFSNFYYDNISGVKSQWVFARQ